MRKGLLQQLSHILLHINCIVGSLDCGGVIQWCSYLIVFHQAEHGGKYRSIHGVAWGQGRHWRGRDNAKKRILPAWDVSVNTENTCCMRSSKYVWKNWVPDRCMANFCNSTSRISCPENNKAKSKLIQDYMCVDTNQSLQRFSWYVWTPIQRHPSATWTEVQELAAKLTRGT